MSSDIERVFVDLADWSTWPDGLERALRRPEGGSDIADLLRGRMFRAYHATRLLPHEVAHVRRSGLRCLSRELVRDRLGEAVRVGAISEEYAARSLAQSEVTIARTPQRLGKAYLCVGHELFSSPEAQRGFDRLLGTWGGEGIYWDADSPIHIGRPTILVVDLAYDAIPDGFRASLTNALRARMLNAPESELSQVAEGYVTSDVPASAIVDIWQPGMAGYDRFDGLPGTPAAARREKERLTMKRQELSETIRLRRADSPT